jgi:predicted dehydrogenase
MSQPKLRVGIVGAGFLARTRVRCYRRVFGVDVELAAVGSRTQERAAAFAREHGIARALPAEAVCADAGVDVVDLCVPNAQHRHFCERAAAAGKHVLCTKPLTAYTGQDLPADADEARVAAQDRRQMLAVALRDAEAMLAATAAARVHLGYAENWLYAPSLQKARALVRSSGGRLLEIRGQEAHSGSHSPFSRQWRHAGGGALLRLGSHPIAAMLQLKRDEGLARGAPIRAASVHADVADLTRTAGIEPARMRLLGGGGAVETWGCAVLAFDDGSRGVAFGGDHLLGGMESSCELFGSNFHLRCSLSPVDAVRAFASVDGTFAGEYLQEKLDTQAGWSTPMPDEDWTSGQQGMVQSFCERLARGEAPLTDGHLGRDVVEVVYAAYLSAATGQRVALG